jgi:TP901 family phage tail tape measure protein
MANVLSIIVRGKDQGAIALLNRVGDEVRKQRLQMEGLRTVSMGLGSASMKALGGGVALAGGLALLGREAATFDQRAREVNTMAHLNEAGFQDLKKSVIDIAKDPLIRDMPAQLAGGLYELQSRGFSGALGLVTLKIAAKGASGGVADLSGTATTLADIMNAYGEKSGPAAQKTMDQLFATVEKGGFRFGQITGQLGGMAAMGSQLGIAFEQPLAALAAMTIQGFNVAESATYIEGAMRSFIKPSEALTKLVKSQGYESAGAAVKQLGLAGAMNMLKQAAGGDQQKLAELVPEMEALRAVLALTGPGAEAFRSSLDRIRNSTGAADQAARQIGEGGMAKYEKALQAVRIEAMGLGEDVLPIMERLIGKVREGVEWFDKLPPGVKKTGMEAVAATAGVLILAGGLGMVTSNVLNLIAAGPQFVGVIATTGRWLAGTGRWLAGLGTGGAAAAAGVAATETAMAAAGPRAETLAIWMQNLSAGGFEILKKGGREAARATRGFGWAAQWAATKTSLSAFSLANLAAWIKGIPAGLKAAATATVTFGKATLAFLVSPVGVAIAAIAALTVELYYLSKSYKEKKAAEEEAKRKQEEEKAARVEAKQRGYISMQDVALGMGYSEKEFQRGLKGKDEERVRQEYLRQVAAQRARGGPEHGVRKERETAAARQAATQQRAGAVAQVAMAQPAPLSPDAKALGFTTQQEFQTWVIGKQQEAAREQYLQQMQPQKGGRGYLSAAATVAQAQAMPAYHVPERVGPEMSMQRGQTVNVLNINAMQFSDPRQMRAFVDRHLDQQFATSGSY